MLSSWMLYVKVLKLTAFKKLTYHNKIGEVNILLEKNPAKLFHSNSRLGTFDKHYSQT